MCVLASLAGWLGWAEVFWRVVYGVSFVQMDKGERDGWQWDRQALYSDLDDDRGTDCRQHAKIRNHQVDRNPLAPSSEASLAHSYDVKNPSSRQVPSENFLPGTRRSVGLSILGSLAWRHVVLTPSDLTGHLHYVLHSLRLAALGPLPLLRARLSLSVVGCCLNDD